MWKRHVLSTGLVSILAIAAPAVASASQTPQHPLSVNAREARQAKRIQHAKTNGELTKSELDRLRADEAALRAKERVFRESGNGLNSAEYKALEENLNRLSKQITRLSHNGKAPGGH